MTRLLVAGYKSFELGIFKKEDERLQIIREAIRQNLVSYLDKGLDWLIFTGNLGFEYWVLEEALLLKQAYDFQMATILAFRDHGQNWNESNQEKLSKFKQLDFVKAVYPSYINPSQLKAYNQFLIDHTDEAFLFYDSEHPTSLRYLADQLQKQRNYTVKTLTFEALNEIAENFSNFDR